MDAKLPGNFTKENLEKMMLKLFPEYNFKWQKLIKMKVIAGKYKGSINNRALLKKSVMNEVSLFYFECPDGSKALMWQSGTSQTFTMLFIFLLGVLPGLIFYLILYFTTLKKRQKAINSLILKEINRLS